MGHVNNNGAAAPGLATPDRDLHGDRDQHRALELAGAEVDRKRFATLQARAALRGIALQTIEGDDGKPLFIASRWALTRSFATQADVSSWLDRVGAPT